MTSLFPEQPPAGASSAPNPSHTGPSIRQEVLNVLVAQLLEERGLVAVPEQLLTLPSGRRRMPDVLVDFQGLRLAIEGEFASRHAEEKASTAALKRVEEGLAHIGVALIYPVSLRSLASEFPKLKSALARESLQFAIVTEMEATQPELPFPFPHARKKEVFAFARGDIDALADGLRRSYEQLVRDEVLEKAIKQLEEGIGVFIGCLIRQPATTGRFASVLGIQELPKLKKQKPESKEE